MSENLVIGVDKLYNALNFQSPRDQNLNLKNVTQQSSNKNVTQSRMNI